ncbi:MAG TPA: alpha/beta fold hydrolase [Methylomirabilota bacterium]|nr:alpha/beta fold hydrolase [Methylomirabilota bacterium]
MRLARPAVAALSALAPGLAARLAERLFLTPERHRAPAHETAALASARRTIVHVDGAPVTAWTWGHGPVVLLVHGWAGRGAQLASFVGPLVANGCSVVTFDAPGHGASPERRSSIVAFVRAIQAVSGALGPVRAVIAHSIGTVAAARALYEGLDADAAVFIAPPADLTLSAHTILETLGFGLAARERMQANIERRLGVAWSALDVRGYAAEMRTPLLVVHDRDDAEVPWQDGAIIARAWPAAALETTGGLGHRRILQDPCVVSGAAAFVVDRVRPGAGLPALEEEATLTPS